MTKEEKEKLIKYLEDKTKELPKLVTYYYERDGKHIAENDIRLEVYKDILERLKGSKYD